MLSISVINCTYVNELKIETLNEIFFILKKTQTIVLRAKCKKRGKVQKKRKVPLVRVSRHPAKGTHWPGGGGSRLALSCCAVYHHSVEVSIDRPLNCDETILVCVFFSFSPCFLFSSFLSFFLVPIPFYFLFNLTPRLVGFLFSMIF